MRRTGILVALGMLLAGCGGDAPSERSSAKTNEPTATPTAAPTEEPDVLTDAAFSALNSSDDDVQAAVTGFQDSLTGCTGRAESAIRSCFSRKYRPYGRSLDRLLTAVNGAQETAGGECATRLEGAEDAARELQGASESLRASFERADYVGVDVEAFGSAFGAYRDDMDEALTSCQP